MAWEAENEALQQELDEHGLFGSLVLPKSIFTWPVLLRAFDN